MIITMQGSIKLRLKYKYVIGLISSVPYVGLSNSLIMASLKIKQRMIHCMCIFPIIDYDNNSINFLPISVMPIKKTLYKLL